MFLPTPSSRISSPFLGGFRRAGGHSGIDFAAPMGSPIRAAVPGRVVSVGWGGGYGNLVKVRHNDGSLGYYAHMSSMGVRVGQQVGRGTVLGRVGSTGNSTGPHLHFEVRRNGRPVDPQPWLDEGYRVGAGASNRSLRAGSYGGVRLNSEQVRNAQTIISVGRSMGASERDLVIGLMTAMQESNLRNLNYGDRDSLGLFQQRPSQGWGTRSQVTNPQYAARKFFESLLRIGDRNNMALTEAAQSVQRSAFPNAYAKWERLARSIMGNPNAGTVPIVGFDQSFTSTITQFRDPAEVFAPLAFEEPGGVTPVLETPATSPADRETPATSLVPEPEPEEEEIPRGVY